MLRATLAERLGLVSAAEADHREAVETRTIDRRMHLLSGGASVRVTEEPVERALRRSGMSGCPMLLRGLLPEPMRGSWCAMHWREVRGALSTPKRCEPWPLVEHALVTAPALRAMRSGRERCAEEESDGR